MLRGFNFIHNIIDDQKIMNKRNKTRTKKEGRKKTGNQ